jgi:hypothetical protein
VQFHFLKECAQDGLIEVSFIKTEGQLGDILTKAFGKSKFEGLSVIIGLRKTK